MTTNAALAAQVSDVLARWNASFDQLQDWLTGDPAGGPNGDGQFPLTNASGETALWLSLPAVVDLVSGPAAAADTSRADAEAAAIAAAASETAAGSFKTLAEAARDTARTHRDEAETFRNDVASKWASVNLSEANVVALEANVVTKAGETAADALAASTDADDAATARAQAQQYRDEAAGFAGSIDPAQFATIVDVDARFEELAGLAPETMDTLAELAAALGDDPNFATTVTDELANKAPLVHGHEIADIVNLQTTLDNKLGLGGGTLTGLLSVKAGTGVGSIRMTSGTTGRSGYLSFYDPAGVRTGYLGYANASDNMFVAENGRGWQFDVTPSVAGLGFVSIVGHGHAIADVTGLQAALDGKQAAGSYASATHTHDWASITGKPTTFAPSAHTHEIADVNGLQTALNGKQPVGSYSLSSHTHDWASITGKPTTFTPAAHTHVIADVTGLQAALDGKLPTAGGSITGNLGVSGTFTLNGGPVISDSGANDQLRVTTPNGYVDIGPSNGTWCHFVTDRGSFYFNKGIEIAGTPKRYNKGALPYYEDAAYADGRIQVSATTPAGSKGTIWLKPVT